MNLPIAERVFSDQIKTMAQLIMHDCETDLKAAELAKRIIDFELNEEFLHNLNEKVMRDEIKDWGLCEDTKATLCEAG